MRRERGVSRAGACRRNPERSEGSSYWYAGVSEAEAERESAEPVLSGVEDEILTLSLTKGKGRNNSCLTFKGAVPKW